MEKNVMNAKIALQAIIDRQKNAKSDIEGDHGRADDILVGLIRDFVPEGNEIADMFEAIDKWYA